MRNPLSKWRGQAHPAPAASGVDAAQPLGAAEWPRHAASRGIRVQPLVALLGAVLVATLGVWGGAELQQRHDGGAASASSLGASAFGSRGAGGNGAAGFFGGRRNGFNGLSSGNLTTGTVTVISGKTLYLTSSSGAIVKVKLTASTTYTRTAKTASTGLKPGDTAIVQGSKNAAGVTVATAVIATAKGVSTDRGRLGGGFAPGSGGNQPAG
jgi:hypothetical protein